MKTEQRKNEDVIVGERIREWADAHYPKYSIAAKDLDIPPQTLNSYMNGKDGLGKFMQAKLLALGADVDYIMTGKRSVNGDKSNTSPKGTGKVENQLEPLKQLPAVESPVLLQILNELIRSNQIMEARLSRLEGASQEEPESYSHTKPNKTDEEKDTESRNYITQASEYQNTFSGASTSGK